MFETHGPAFFAALRTAAERRLGPGHPCHVAAARAAAAPPADITATLAVQEALTMLEAGICAELMADVHRIMREAVTPILANWGATGPAH